jgi:hypothetical protein
MIPEMSSMDKPISCSRWFYKEARTIGWGSLQLRSEDLGVPLERQCWRRRGGKLEWWCRQWRGGDGMALSIVKWKGGDGRKWWRSWPSNILNHGGELRTENNGEKYLYSLQLNKSDNPSSLLIKEELLLCLDTTQTARSSQMIQFKQLHKYQNQHLWSNCTALLGFWLVDFPWNLNLSITI